MSLFETIRDRSIELTRLHPLSARSGSRSGERGERSPILGRLLGPRAEVAPGEVYRHRDADGRIEIATVVGMCEILEMPHVKFRLRIERPDYEPFEGGERVINLKTFRQHFGEQLELGTLDD